MSKRIIGLDFGSRRIGVAISDPMNIIATGLCVIENSPKVVEKIKELIKNYDVDKIVLGMPLNLKGNKGMKAREVDEFLKLLNQSLGIEIITFDERFSTRQAQMTIRELNVKKSQRQKKDKIDAMAAAVILQNYLDKVNKLKSI